MINREEVRNRRGPVLIVLIASLILPAVGCGSTGTVTEATPSTLVTAPTTTAGTTTVPSTTVATSTPVATSTTSADESTTTAVTTQPARESFTPIIVDIAPDPDGDLLLSRAVSNMFDTVSYQFRKDIHITGIYDNPGTGRIVVDETANEGRVVGRAVAVNAHPGPILAAIAGGSPGVRDFIENNIDTLSYQAVETGGFLYAYSPFLGAMSDAIGLPGPLEEYLRPMFDSWVRIDRPIYLQLTDVMFLAGDAWGTDPRDLFDLLDVGRRAGSPVTQVVKGRPLTRIDVVVPLDDLFLVNGDDDHQNVLELLSGTRALNRADLEELDAALAASEAMVSVYVNDEALVERVEFELGEQAVAPALSDRDHLDALAYLNLGEHVVMEFFDFDDPGLTVDPPKEFEVIDLSPLFNSTGP